MSLSISEQIMHSTVRIEVLNQTGLIQSTGTGFFFAFSIKENRNVPVLVTNKHVVKDAKVGRLVFTIASANDDPQYGEKFSYVIT